MMATCYKCGKEYEVKLTAEQADAVLLDEMYDPTDWECPACSELEDLGDELEITALEEDNLC